MRHRRAGSIVLLASCSHCKEDFREGAARHMLGYYPLEQFCSYTCVEKYLLYAPGLKRAIPAPSPHRGKGLLIHPE